MDVIYNFDEDGPSVQSIVEELLVEYYLEYSKRGQNHNV